MEHDVRLTTDAKKPLTGFHLKVIALVCMISDHTCAALELNSLWGMRCIGRIAFPIYAFLIAEGCRHTASRERYLLRLGTFALISEIPFDLAFDGIGQRPLSPQVDFLSFTNVFYTFFIAVACIHLYETLRRQRWGFQVLGAVFFAASAAGILITLLFVTASKKAALIQLAIYFAGMLAYCALLSRKAETPEEPLRPTWLTHALSLLPILPLCLLAELVGCDYDWIGVVMVLGAYFVKKRPGEIAVLAACILYLYKNTIQNHLIYQNALGYHLHLYNGLSICFTLLSLIFIYFYNGERGKNVKWAFYWAYPGHIAILAALRYLLLA